MYSESFKYFNQFSLKQLPFWIAFHEKKYYKIYIIMHLGISLIWFKVIFGILWLLKLIPFESVLTILVSIFHLQSDEKKGGLGRLLLQIESVTNKKN